MRGLLNLKLYRGPGRTDTFVLSILQVLLLSLLFAGPTSATPSIQHHDDPSFTSSETPWLGWGANQHNNRWASTNKHIKSSTLNSSGCLTLNCQIPFPGGVSAPPTIINSTTAYLAAWNGTVAALDYTTCTLKWQINVTAVIFAFRGWDEMPPIQQTVMRYHSSRTTPSVDLEKRVVYFGTSTHALVVAADMDSGEVLGVRQVNAHPLAQVTQSGTLVKGDFYVGTASSEESIQFYYDDVPAAREYVCCTFRGNMVGLRFDRERREWGVLWDVSMLVPPPDGGGGNNGTGTGEDGFWSGAAIWGSAPSVDVERNQIFVATGNMYSVPKVFLPCTENPSHPSCELPSRIWQEAVVAIDMTTGNVNWVRRLGVLDVYTVGCRLDPPNPDLCPGEPGPDADFGMAPTFVPGYTRDLKGGKKKKFEDRVVIGQKNGILFSLSAATGKVEWASTVGPGGEGGGLTWGIAVDKERVYYVVYNSDRKKWKLKGLKMEIDNSAYGAADLDTGKVLWQTPVLPSNFTSNHPPTLVGDVVLLGRQFASEDLVSPAVREGALVALHKDTGQVMLDFELDTYFVSGPAVYGKYIFVGTGYHGLLDGSLYVFSV